MRFEKCMGTPGGHRGSFILSLESAWGTLWVIGRHLFEVREGIGCGK